MENFRSMSCREGRVQQMEDNNYNYSYGGGGGPPTNMQDLRSYSTSYASSNYHNNNMQIHPQPSTKDSKGGGSTNNNQKKNRGLGGSSSSSSKSWSLSDPELQRKKRVASYKVYGVEGKMKGSFRKSFRWVKHTCSQVAHALW